MGMARLIFKPLFSLIDTVVDATPNKADDAAWKDVKSSKAMAFVTWILDYFASVKVNRKG